jgi:hypothetical protein
MAHALGNSQFFQGEVPQGPFLPFWESLKAYHCPDWFRDAKFGIWAHWSPQCVPEQGDWYARNMYIQGSRQYEYHVKTYGHPSQFGYKDICHLWKAERWDPDALVELYKRAGAEYGSGANSKGEWFKVMIWKKWADDERVKRHEGSVCRAPFRPGCDHPLCALVLMLQAQLS